MYRNALSWHGEPHAKDSVTRCSSKVGPTSQSCRSLARAFRHTTSATSVPPTSTGVANWCSCAWSRMPQVLPRYLTGWPPHPSSTKSRVSLASPPLLIGNTATNNQEAACQRISASKQSPTPQPRLKVRGTQCHSSLDVLLSAVTDSSRRAHSGRKREASSLSLICNPTNLLPRTMPLPLLALYSIHTRRQEPLSVPIKPPSTGD